MLTSGQVLNILESALLELHYIIPTVHAASPREAYEQGYRRALKVAFEKLEQEI